MSFHLRLLESSIRCIGRLQINADRFRVPDCRFDLVAKFTLYLEAQIPNKRVPLKVPVKIHERKALGSPISSDALLRTLMTFVRTILLGTAGRSGERDYRKT